MLYVQTNLNDPWAGKLLNGQRVDSAQYFVTWSNRNTMVMIGTTIDRNAQLVDGGLYGLSVSGIGLN